MRKEKRKEKAKRKENPRPEEIAISTKRETGNRRRTRSGYLPRSGKRRPNGCSFSFYILSQKQMKQRGEREGFGPLYSFLSTYSNSTDVTVDIPNWKSPKETLLQRLGSWFSLQNMGAQNNDHNDNNYNNKEKNVKIDNKYLIGKLCLNDMEIKIWQ